VSWHSAHVETFLHPHEPWKHAENYVWNYALDLPAIAKVQDGSGADMRYYLPDGTRLYSIQAVDNTRHFFHFDEMESTTFLSDDSGSITDSHRITPYRETVTPGPVNATASGGERSRDARPRSPPSPSCGSSAIPP
jgi:hypothetical protein